MQTSLKTKGRPKGAKNKATDFQKQELQEILFDVEDMAREFKNLDALVNK